MPVRKQAINMMSNIYRQAKRTMVHDKMLLEIEDVQPFEEQLIRLLTSKWMHRVWTLQEYVLSANPSFEYSHLRKIYSFQTMMQIQPKKFSLVAYKLQFYINFMSPPAEDPRIQGGR